MECRQFRSLLEAYALGELVGNELTDCQAHIEACSNCRQAVDAYAGIVSAIASEPLAAPSESESASLAKALAGIELCPAPQRTAPDAVPQGLPGFALASVLVFLLVAGVLALQRFGVIDIVSFAHEIGLQWIALAVVVVIVVTSFIPIAVTAHRRPLNGMTFRG